MQKKSVRELIKYVALVVGTLVISVCFFAISFGEQYRCSASSNKCQYLHSLLVGFWILSVAFPFFVFLVWSLKNGWREGIKFVVYFLVTVVLISLFTILNYKLKLFGWPF